MSVTKPAMVALLLAGCAAPPPSGACAQPDVVARVLERLGRAGEYAAAEPGSVGEVPAGPGRVNCALRVRRLVHDTVRLGPVPAAELSEVQYALELRRNAIFLLP